MEKEHIINEFKKQSEQNGGQPLSIIRFEETTGIKKMTGANIGLNLMILLLRQAIHQISFLLLHMKKIF